MTRPYHLPASVMANLRSASPAAAIAWGTALSGSLAANQCPAMRAEYCPESAGSPSNDAQSRCADRTSGSGSVPISSPATRSCTMVMHSPPVASSITSPCCDNSERAASTASPWLVNSPNCWVETYPPEVTTYVKTLRASVLSRSERSFQMRSRLGIADESLSVKLATAPPGRNSSASCCSRNGLPCADTASSLQISTLTSRSHRSAAR